MTAWAAAAAAAEEGGEPAPPRPLSVREQSDAAAGTDLTGLEHLGETGLGWLKKFKSCEEEAPAQAAMEFLAAAIWLGMTTGEAAKPAPEVIWALSAPPGGAETWWKMSLLERPLFERADPTGLLSSDMSASPAYLR